MVNLWFLIRKEEREGSRTLRNRLQVSCRGKGWFFAERLAHEVRDVRGRPTEILHPRDFNEVYRGIHRGLGAIVDARDIRVLRDPRDFGSHPRIGKTALLRSLVAYKALIFDATTKENDRLTADQIVDQLAGIEISLAQRQLDARDPRALPFLSFNIGAHAVEDLELDSTEGRLRFKKTYGPPHMRTDEREVLWKLNPRAFHGIEQLLLRGERLPTGCHWDVEVNRGSVQIFLANEVWKIRVRGYLNLYPDMYVRAGGGNKSGRRTWPRKT